MRASVVMATYNGIEYLKEQLDSILRGMDSMDELLVADDGSNDGTIKLVEKYAMEDDRVRLLPDCSHKGVIGNFDYGISESNGDIILLADQDDVWFPNKIHTVKHLFESDSELTCIVSDLTVIDGEGNQTAPSFFELRQAKVGYWNNLLKNSFIGNAMAFRATMKPYILAIPVTAPMHDQWIGLINERYGKVLFLHEALGAYRRHGHNVTGMSHGSVSSMVSKRWNLVRELGRRSKRIKVLHKQGAI